MKTPKVPNSLKNKYLIITIAAVTALTGGVLAITPDKHTEPPVTHVTKPEPKPAQEQTETTTPAPAPTAAQAPAPAPQAVATPVAAPQDPKTAAYAIIDKVGVQKGWNSEQVAGQKQCLDFIIDGTFGYTDLTRVTNATQKIGDVFASFCSAYGLWHNNKFASSTWGEPVAQ